MKQESWLEVRSGRAKGRRWSIPEGRSSIGRSIGNDLRLRDAGVSRYHVELRHVGGRPEVRDRGSKNGAYIDGRRVDVEWHALVHGQELEVGEVTPFAEQHHPHDQQDEEPQDLIHAVLLQEGRDLIREPDHHHPADDDRGRLCQ